MNKLSLLAILLGTFVFVPGLHAQAPTGAQTLHSDFALPDKLQNATKRSLSLEEALTIAVENNLGIRLQQETYLQSKYRIGSSRQEFQPTLRANFDYNDSISPPSTSLDGSPGATFTSKTQRWSAGISKKLEFGTSLSLDFFGSRNQSSAGSAVEPLFYGSNLSLSLTQPILRGFSFDGSISRAPILQATFESKHALEEKRLVIAKEIRRVENAYWDLAENLRSYGLQKASLALALDQLELTQKQIAAGILAPSDLIGTESTVASRELALLRAETSLEASMDRLRQILNLPEDKWKEVLIAKDLPQVIVRNTSYEDALNDALRSRPEAKQNSIRKKQSDLAVDLADNRQLPSLDLGFRYGLVGQSNVLSSSLDQLQGLGARNWGVFVNLSWQPLSPANRAAKEIASSSDRQRELRYQQFIVQLRSEIRGAIRRIENAEEQVVASEKFRILAERSLDAERRRFLTGKSRNLEVSRREDEVARARSAELSAKIAFLKAVSDFDLATGKLLERKQIQLKVR